MLVNYSHHTIKLNSKHFQHTLGIEPGEDEDGEDAVHDKINQDRGCVVYPYRSSEDEALFMVLDGHGEQGDRISEFVMRQVIQQIHYCEY